MALIYQDALSDFLEQGDLLKLTSGLNSLLDAYHPYYARHEKNKFYVVLTQSCDLVVRGGLCKAKYISIAPVRPLRHVIGRVLDGKVHNMGPGLQAYAGVRAKASLSQFLERLFRNNESPFFYYEAEHGRGIYDDMCAILSLGISVKSEHYDVLRGAKVIGIRDVFQAKLGWLVGQIYSRVGTPDFDDLTLSKKIKEHVDGLIAWLDDSDEKSLRGIIAAERELGPSRPIDASEFLRLKAKIPKKKSVVIDKVLDVASRLGYFPDEAAGRARMRRALENDAGFSQIFR